MAREIFLIAAASGLVSVALGAFGAHALKDRLDEYSLRVFHTGVDYQFWHTLALLLIGILMGSSENQFLRWAAWSFVIGIFFFSGSLYLLALTGVKTWGAVTPVGGTAFLFGWGVLFYAFWKQ